MKTKEELIELFDELFDSKEQAVIAYTRLERWINQRIHPRTQDEKITMANNQLEELKEWAEKQMQNQLAKDSPFTLDTRMTKSIWGQVISKINSMMEASK